MSATQSHVSVDRRHNVEDRRSPANRRQEGGAHYGLGELQHWDIVHIFNLDYFQGNITKYVFRHKDKRGLEDLLKALHYLEKYLETEYNHVAHPAPEPEPPVYVDPPAGHNRFLRKAARIGALYTMSAHAFAHCMGITEGEAMRLLDDAKAEGDYVPPEKRKTSLVERGLLAMTGLPGGKTVGEALREEARERERDLDEPEGDSLCGASLTESSEFPPAQPLSALLEEMYLSRAAAAWDAGWSPEHFADVEHITLSAARALYNAVSITDPHDA